MLQVFRCVSFAEGASFLLLLFVAMPAKYFYGMPQMVTVVGGLHGVLFMAYAILANIVASRYRWPARFSSTVFVASMLPFAFLWVEWRLRVQKWA